MNKPGTRLGPVKIGSERIAKPPFGPQNSVRFDRASRSAVEDTEMIRAGLCLPTALLAAAVTAAAAQELPRLQTNEAYVNEATTRTQKLAIDDPMAVFAYVLGSLPDRVKVYPTENHYYFSFDLNGTRYAGNIKIDALSARARQGRILLLRRSRRAGSKTARRPD